MEGYGYGGGFIAFAAYKTSLTDCSASGDVNGGWTTGGFAGLLYSDITVLRCAASGKVTASEWNLGGFAGYAEGTVSISNCVAFGNVESTKTQGSLNVGGFLGADAGGGMNMTMTKCHAAGNVTVAYQDNRAGAMIGQANRSARIIGCSYYGEEASLPAIGADGSIPVVCEITDAPMWQLKRSICEDYYGGHDMMECAATPPSCTEDGREAGEQCRRCFCETGFAPIAKLGHEFENGVCKRCGEKDPNVCEGGENCPGRHFTDMPGIDNWAHCGIDYAVEHGLFAGMEQTMFGPNVTMTRAMLVRVIWLMAGSPEHDGENPFSDVTDKDWFYDGVVWAAENGIVAGMGDGTFAPNDEITREQLAAILYRYCVYNGVNVDQKADLSVFPDAAVVSDWAKEALAWANANGFVSGSKEDESVYLRPKNDATRAQVAAILMRFCRAMENERSDASNKPKPDSTL